MKILYEILEQRRAIYKGGPPRRVESQLAPLLPNKLRRVAKYLSYTVYSHCIASLLSTITYPLTTHERAHKYKAFIGS
jgi:hypothetical protein